MAVLRGEYECGNTVNIFAVGVGAGFEECDHDLILYSISANGYGDFDYFLVETTHHKD